MKRTVDWISYAVGHFRATMTLWLCLGLAWASSAIIWTNQQSTNLPPALSSVPLDRLSSGALMLLDTNGTLVHWPSAVRRPKISADPSLLSGLDPRVGANQILSNEPPQLPTNMVAQAEPHITRDPNNNDALAATFQEGRYTDGGAVDCGYAISHDGGLSWTRALIPGLTTAVGGPYPRASDPVAAIDHRGTIYLNPIAIIDSNQTMTAQVLCRSTNGGATFDPPIEAVRSPDSSVFLDKNWLAVNSFSNTPTAGRVFISYTRFENTGYYPQARVYSDDGGNTWAPWTYVTDPASYTQGSQPFFLPDGTLALVYFDFAPQEPVYAYLQLVISTNGGDTFTYSNKITNMLLYSAPLVRNGGFLPSACGNRTDNTLYVAYQGLYPDNTNAPGGPSILFTKSSDGGVTWTTPKPINDSPTNTPVFNPAISVSPDGQMVTVIFYDERVNPGNTNLVDLFLAQSLDGGNTWQPNIRLTSVSSDVTVAPLTGSGYMLGDYQGVAPAVGTDVPAVPVSIDTRLGNPNPFFTRIGISSSITFHAWRAARLSLSQISTLNVGVPGADPDHDGVVNALEYAFGLNPVIPDQPVFSTPKFSGSGPSAALKGNYQRLAGTSDLTFAWLSSSNLVNWVPASGVTEAVVPDANPRFEDVTVNFGPNSGSRVPQFYRLGVTRSP